MERLAAPRRGASSTTRRPRKRSSRTTGSCASGPAATTTTCRPSTARTSRWSTCRIQGRRTGHREGARRQRRRVRGRLHHLRQRFRDHHRDQPPVCDRRHRGPRRPVALRPLARQLQDAPRHDQPRLPQPVLHRLHPGRGRGEHHRDVRAAGRAHRLHHRRSAWRAARPPSSRARKLKTTGSRPSGRLRSTTRSSNSPAPPAITTTKAAAAERASGRFLGDLYSPGFYAFDDLLKEWRAKGDLDGLVLGT